MGEKDIVTMSVEGKFFTLPLRCCTTGGVAVRKERQNLLLWGGLRFFLSFCLSKVNGVWAQFSFENLRLIFTLL